MVPAMLEDAFVQRVFKAPIAPLFPRTLVSTTAPVNHQLLINVESASLGSAFANRDILARAVRPNWNAHPNVKTTVFVCMVNAFALLITQVLIVNNLSKAL
jgi:hypothetical protein